MDCPRLGAVLHTTGLWGRSYIGVGRRAASRTWQKLCHREDTGLPWGKHYHGRIHIWDYPKGNQAIRTPSPVQGLTGDPGELTPVLGLASVWLGGAESNCAREPARQAGQREPLPPDCCASGSNGTIDIPVVVQRKGVGVDGTEGGAFWGILTELPGSRTGLARGAWGGTSSPNRTLLATGKMGRGREWGGRASHTVIPWTWEPGGKGNCSFFEKVGTYDRNKMKQKILLPALHRGKERRCSRRLLRKSKLQHLRVAWVRAASSTSWTDLGPGWDAGGRRSPARGSTHRPMCRFGLGRSTHGDGQTEAWPRGQRSMVHHAGAGCAGSPQSAAVPPRTVPRSPRRCRRTALPGIWGRRESVPCRRPSSLPGWARDGAPGPPWWTSPSRGTAPWLSSLVERSQSPCAAPASTPGRYYPRAPVWAPWLGEPAG